MINLVAPKIGLGRQVIVNLRAADAASNRDGQRVGGEFPAAHLGNDGGANIGLHSRLHWLGIDNIGSGHQLNAGEVEAGIDGPNEQPVAIVLDDYKANLGFAFINRLSVLNDAFHVTPLVNENKHIRHIGHVQVINRGDVYNAQTEAA